jgi:hypothetical protein
MLLSFKAMPVILTTDEERDVWNARAVGRSEGAAAAASGRRAEDRQARRRQGRQSGCMTSISIYPLKSGRLYMIGELRGAEAALLLHLRHLLCERPVRFR